MTDELKAEREAFEKYRSEHAPGLSESAYPIWQAAWQARAKLDQKPTSEEYGFVSIYDAEYTLQRGRGASDEQAQFLALREVVKSARATHTTGGDGDE